MLYLAHATLFTVLLLAATADAFYIPGMEPKAYEEGETVKIKVNSLRSLRELFPQEYYKLPFCTPTEVVTEPETIGEVIWGDRRQNSLYTVQMKKNVTCMQLPNCNVSSNNLEIQEQIDLLESYIEKEYRGFMNIDNLPVFDNMIHTQFPHCNMSGNDVVPKAYRGYSLGVRRACMGKTLINNHLDFVIKYNTVPGNETSLMVVGLQVTPYSIKHNEDGSSCGSSLNNKEDISALTTDDVRSGTKVFWTYGVTWISSDIVWATRWDAYLQSSIADSNAAFHWVYVCSSLVLVLLCASSVTAILMRALHKDFNRYNLTDPESNQEETGWKLVHADVFRTPYRAPLLASLTGNGFQVLAMMVGVLLLALFGFLSPARRGALLTAFIMLFVFMSVVAGYVCGLLLKYFNCREWKHIFFCGCAFPGTIVAIYGFANIIKWSHGSSDAISFFMWMITMALWIFTSLPLTIVGAAFAFSHDPPENPVSVGRLAREIPPQFWMSSASYLCVVPALFPLCTIILEFNFILQALWDGQVYYVFGFLAIVFVIWITISALVTVFHLYYILCYENHQWWWYSFIIPGGLGVHVFLYSLYFYMTRLTISSFASSLLYFLYMGLLSCAYGIASGAIGLTSGILFVRTIYGRIKVD